MYYSFSKLNLITKGLKDITELFPTVSGPRGEEEEEGSNMAEKWEEDTGNEFKEVESWEASAGEAEDNVEDAKSNDARGDGLDGGASNSICSPAIPWE